jgi:hypothetical protein
VQRAIRERLIAVAPSGVGGTFDCAIAAGMP